MSISYSQGDQPLSSMGLGHRFDVFDCLWVDNASMAYAFKQIIFGLIFVYIYIYMKLLTFTSLCGGIHIH